MAGASDACSYLDVLDVSVPCPNCSGAIHFADRRCPQCEGEVSQELRHELEARLDAASPELREYKAHVNKAVFVLLGVALFNVGLGAVVYFVSTGGDVPLSELEESVALADLIVDYVTASIFLGCALWARRSPVAGMGCAVVAWVAVHLVLAATIEPSIRGLWEVLFRMVMSNTALGLERLAVTVALLSGLRHARRATALRRELVGAG